jgi:hypothetical protein
MVGPLRDRRGLTAQKGLVRLSNLCIAFRRDPI